MSQYVLFLKSVITSWKTAAVKQAPRSVCIFWGTENTFIHKSTSCKLFRNTQSPWLFLSIDYRGMHVKDAILFSKRLKQINVRIFISAQTFPFLFARISTFFHEWQYVLQNRVLSSFLAQIFQRQCLFLL